MQMPSANSSTSLLSLGIGTAHERLPGGRALAASAAARQKLLSECTTDAVWQKQMPGHRSCGASCRREEATRCTLREGGWEGVVVRSSGCCAPDRRSRPSCIRFGGGRISQHICGAAAALTAAVKRTILFLRALAPTNESGGRKRENHKGQKGEKATKCATRPSPRVRCG